MLLAGSFTRYRKYHHPPLSSFANKITNRVYTDRKCIPASLYSILNVTKLQQRITSLGKFPFGSIAHEEMERTRLSDFSIQARYPVHHRVEKKMK